MDYTLSKMSIFCLFFKHKFSGLKIIIFHPEYKKNVFSDLITPNKRKWKKLDFWTKTMDQPLRKTSCFALFRTFIFWSQNQSFLSKILKNDLTCFLPKSKWEKVWCLDRNNGLSPLENVDVLHFLKLYFSGLKIILFYPQFQKMIFSDLIIPKNPNEKKIDIWTKQRIIPLGKWPFFSTFSNFSFLV